MAMNHSTDVQAAYIEYLRTLHLSEWLERRMLQAEDFETFDHYERAFTRAQLDLARKWDHYHGLLIST